MSSVRRLAWETGNRMWAHGVAFGVVVIITRTIGLGSYGEYVVMLALLAATTLAWNITVLQAAASDLGLGGSQRQWDRHLIRWLGLGVLIVTPLAWVLWGPVTAGVIMVCAVAEAFRVRALPLLILHGAQRRIAIASGASNGLRLAIVTALAAAGWLTPESAVLSQGAAYVVAAILHGRPACEGDRPHRPLRAELSIEVLRWVENYAPVLGIAAIVGISTAGGFDMILKLLAVIVEIFAAIGLIVLPRLVGGGRRTADALATSLRASTVAAAFAAVGFVVVGGPFLGWLAGVTISAGASLIILAVVIVLAPWEGVSKAALVARSESWWLLPAQVAVSLAAFTGASLTAFGVAWAAAAISIGHVLAASVCAAGLRRSGGLPPRAMLFSSRRTVNDVRSIWASWIAVATYRR